MYVTLWPHLLSIHSFFPSIRMPGRARKARGEWGNAMNIGEMLMERTLLCNFLSNLWLFPFSSLFLEVQMEPQCLIWIILWGLLCLFLNEPYLWNSALPCIILWCYFFSMSPTIAGPLSVADFSAAPDDSAKVRISFKVWSLSNC